MRFGAFIRKQRTARCMTLTELATEVGLSLAYLSRIERGWEKPPRDDVVHKLATTLGPSDDAAFAAARRLPPDLQQRAGEVFAAYRRLSGSNRSNAHR